MTPRAATDVEDLDRRLAAGSILACVLLWAAIAAPWLAGRLYVFDDLGAYHLPLRVFYSTCLARGESFDWMPQLYCGWFVTGEGQVGAYHPAHWLLYRGLAWPTAFGLELLSSYAFLCGGCYVLFRRWLSRAAAAYGALVGGFSGFVLLHFAHVNAVAVLAHVPWLLAVQDVLWRTAARPRVPLLARPAVNPANSGPQMRAAATLAVALLTASQLLLGYPQYVWFSLLAEAGFALYHAIALENRPAAARVLVRWTLAKLLGALIAAVQLLPTYEALRESTRVAAKPSFAMSGSLHPANLVQLVAPYALRTRVVGDNTHELGLYCGAVPLALIAWLLGTRMRMQRPVLWIGLGVVVALGLALGRYGLLYRGQTWLPVVGSFRFPSRTICLVQFGVAALAAIAWQQLVFGRRQSDVSPTSSSWLWMLVAGAGAGALAVSVASPSERLAAWPLVIAGPLLVAIAGGLVAAAAAGRAGAWTALIVLTALDLGAYGLSYAIYPGARRAEEWLADIDQPPGPSGARLLLNSGLGDVPRTRYIGNQVLLAGWRRADGYSGLVPAGQLDGRDRPLPEIEAASVAWMAIPGRWQAVPDPAPRARIEGAADGQVRVVHDRPGKIVLETESDGPAQLIVSERFHRGWQAQCDGRTLPAACADGAWLACNLTPGKHHVEFHFEPASLVWGRRLSALGTVLSLSWFAVGMFPWRTAKGSKEPAAT